MPTLSIARQARVEQALLEPGLCILVVEDNEADAYLICRALVVQPMVASVVRASDGVEAQRMVEDGEVSPDLAFIDLTMPRKGGLSLLATFADRAPPRFPVVVLTSSACPADAMRSRLKGAVSVLTKPSTYPRLQARLSREVNRVKFGAWSG